MAVEACKTPYSERGRYYAYYNRLTLYTLPLRESILGIPNCPLVEATSR